MQLADDPAWLERAENCLIFGPSGVGKTHVAAGLARATVERGKRAKFFAATTLVQQLQQAKLQLQLSATLSHVDCQEQAAVFMSTLKHCAYPPGMTLSQLLEKYLRLSAIRSHRRNSATFSSFVVKVLRHTQKNVVG